MTEAVLQLPPEILRLTQQLEAEKYDALMQRFETQRKESACVVSTDSNSKTTRTTTTQNDAGEVLKARLKKSEEDTHEFVAYFQKELASKDARIGSLSELVSSRDEERDAERASLKEEHRVVVEGLESQLANSESMLTSKVKTLEDELAKVEAFRESKRTTDAKIADLEARVREAEQKLEAESTANERKFLVEKSKMHKELEKRTAEARRQVKLETQNGLDADTLRVLSDNRRMAEELKFQQTMTCELQDEKNRLSEEVKVLRRNLELAAEKEAEFARQARTRKKTVAKLQDQNQSLEDTLAETRKTFALEKASLKKGMDQDLEDQTLDAAGLKQLLRLKNKELAQVRKLAEIILEQRTEVEQFFLEALADVKDLIREQRRQRYRLDVAEYRAKVKRAVHDQGHSFPKIRALQAGRNLDDLPPELPSQLPTAVQNKVYLKDLSLEDRERVLRLLFAKINAVHSSVPTMPPHDLDHTFVTNSAAFAESRCAGPVHHLSVPPSSA